MHKCFTVLICFCSSVLYAQTKMGLGECERLFLKNNLHLLADHYNIEVAKAQIIQAGLWENPYLSADFNAVNPQEGKVLDFQRRGQKAFAVQQLIYLGHKKQKEVELAKTNVQIAELQFKDLLRNLKFQMRSSFFSLYSDQAAVAALDKQLLSLDSLIISYSAQVQKGNLPLKDLVRLQTLYVGIQNDRTTLVNAIVEAQSKLSVFLASEEAIIPAPTSNEISQYQKTLTGTLDLLQQLALQNREDVQLADKSKEAAQKALTWQQSLAIPDLTVGAAYDQRGGAFNHQINLTVGVPLRLWNKNQGNIKAADAQLKMAMLQKDIQVMQLKTEVKMAYQKYGEAKKNYQLIDTAFQKSFNDVHQGVYLNFQRRNVSLIEFTDFMESYSQHLLQFNQIQKALINACEEINYATGSTLF